MSAVIADGLSEQLCQCTGCGQAFTGTAPFDRHRVGEYAKPGHFKGTRRCLAPSELSLKGWFQSAKGFWSPPLHNAKSVPADLSTRPRASA